MKLALGLVLFLASVYVVADYVAPPPPVVVDESGQIVVGKGSCSCEGHNCSCCDDIKFSFKGIDFDKVVCVAIVYDPDTKSLEIELTLDGKVIWHDTKSASDPNFCVKIPIEVLEALGVEICVDFENLDLQDKHISGCIDISVKWRFGTILHPQQLGCFNHTV